MKVREYLKSLDSSIKILQYVLDDKFLELNIHAIVNRDISHVYSSYVTNNHLKRILDEFANLETLIRTKYNEHLASKKFELLHEYERRRCIKSKVLHELNKYIRDKLIIDNYVKLLSRIYNLVESRKININELREAIRELHNYNENLAEKLIECLRSMQEINLDNKVDYYVIELDKNFLAIVMYEYSINDRVVFDIYNDTIERDRDYTLNYDVRAIIVSERDVV